VDACPGGASEDAGGDPVVRYAAVALLLAAAYTATATGQLPIQPEPIVDTQNPPPADPSLLAEWTRATAGGWAIRMPNGGIYNIVDVQGGTYIPGRPKRLNFNISAGDHRHRGYVVITPDNGKGLIVEDGHLHKLLLVRSGRYGGTEFRTPVRFERGLTVCDSSGCVDVLKRLRER
jgi:hypothetical protein